LSLGAKLTENCAEVRWWGSHRRGIRFRVAFQWMDGKLSIFIVFCCSSYFDSLTTPQPLVLLGLKLRGTAAAHVYSSAIFYRSKYASLTELCHSFLFLDKQRIHHIVHVALRQPLHLGHDTIPSLCSSSRSYILFAIVFYLHLSYLLLTCLRSSLGGSDDAGLRREHLVSQPHQGK
jgi:hypothetical protein